MQTMRAARLNVDTGELRLDDVSIPRPEYGQVRVRVRAAGICLSDVHLIRGHGKPAYLDGPEVTLGHENAGVIDEIGPGVEGWMIGDRVTVFAGLERNGVFLTMGVDFDGGWANYTIVAASNLVRLPEAISFEQGCILGDAVATSWSAIHDTAQVKAGESVGVWGLGGLGIHAVSLLRFSGAAPIIAIDPLEKARTRALERGADIALDPTATDFQDKLIAAAGDTGLDVAMDFVGHPSAQTQGLEALGRQGRLTVVGISGQPLTIQDSFGLILKKQQILGHYATEKAHLERIVRLIESGRLDFSESVTATYSLDDLSAAVDRLESKDGNPIRLVLVP